MESITIALSGNPNSGKTTVFNNLTGTRQHVGNWPGVTVEKKEGKCKHQDIGITVVDLPGTYSLTAYSMEEIIARDFVLDERPDVVVDIVDASNLERNLYLATQFLELDANLVIALNMIDVAKLRGIVIDAEKLSTLLGVPVIPMVATKNQGTEELLDAILKVAQNGWKREPERGVHYGREIEEELDKIEEGLEGTQIVGSYDKRWVALKLLENDEAIVEKVKAEGEDGVLKTAENSVRHLEEIFGDDVESAIVDRRYGFISGAGTEVIHRTAEIRHTRSDKIDKIVTNRVLGIPIFLVAMWFVFQMTANVSGAYLDWVNGVISGPITHWILRILGAIELGDTWVSSLFVNGIIAGVGGVLVFIPVLFFLYFFIALLEDSGYMARAAFVMDRLMHTLGLHGKSFIPLLIGFGCNVPAIYATRTIEDEKDRILTGLLVPMMSCAARLPVYIIFAATFFPKNSGWVIFAMYILGIVAAIGSGALFKRTLFRGKEESTFIMELPPYRLPTFKSVLIHMWERTYAFVRKAWTIILAASIIVWFLTNIPWGVENKANSLFGKVSKGIAPIFVPAGYGEWQATGALVTGFVAKEVVVSTMSEIYAVGAEKEEEKMPTFIEDVREIVVSFGTATVDTVKMTISLIPGVNLMGEEEEEEDTGLVNALRSAFTPLSAASFMVFVLLYVPCMVAIAALRQEFGTKWMFFSTGYLMVLAWVVSVIVYQGGRLFGLS